MGGGGGMGGGASVPKLCQADDECDDGEFCNGREKCNPEADAANSKGCVIATSTPCEEACDEGSDECVSCEEGDVDKDGHKAIACEGDDCDDNDEDRYPGNVEVCDSSGHDEDCKLGTLGGPSDADKDQDTFVDAACCNTQEDGDLECGDDCDDDKSGINPGQEEACNAVDDNCDGVVDGETTEGDLKTTYYADADGDDFGDESTATQACMPPDTGWILNAGDCQDDLSAEPLATSIYPGAVELCNGIDDDCDGNVDKADDNLEASPSNPSTDYDCIDGGWQITACPVNKEHCDNNVLNGCETDGTTRENCHGCNTSCIFSCGSAGCDEIASFGGGTYHTCAVTQQGSVSCWGRGTSGQIGDGAKASRDVPVYVGSFGATSVAGGFAHTCALGSGQVYCWGSNANGQLGLGGAAEALTPTAVSGITQATRVDAGQFHTCAVVAGAVRCWGQQQFGRLGNTLVAAANVAAPGNAVFEDTQPFTDAVSVATGDAHTCVLRSGGTVACFGNNAQGQLGLPSVSGAQGYAEELSMSGVSSLAAGAVHTCAVASGKVYCWGDNNSGQLGTQAASPVTAPAEVPGISGATQVSTGNYATCARLNDGTMKCWGRNQYGELSAPASGTTPVPTPVTVPLSNVVSGMTKGEKRTCAVVQGPAPGNRRGYCFGNDDSGMLGNGSAGATNVPFQLILAP
jgi:alpha-tubulin suppressor-like RCC1 family protein